jgi:hypothetical protein
VKLEFDPQAYKVDIDALIRDGRYIDITTKVAGNTWKMVLDTQDRLIREGLVKLGWTPPAPPMSKSEKVTLSHLPAEPGQPRYFSVPIFQDEGLTIQLPNPLIADAQGRWPDVWVRAHSPQSAGGRARALQLPPERRREIAKKAAETRWGR